MPNVIDTHNKTLVIFGISLSISPALSSFSSSGETYRFDGAGVGGIVGLGAMLGGGGGVDVIVGEEVTGLVVVTLFLSSS
jgi:hypothetical protein